MISIETNMAAFNSTLAQYTALSSKTPREARDKKVVDLGIRLYQKFNERKYGGPGARKAGLAKVDLKGRTASGLGTRVRKSIMAAYVDARNTLRSAVRNFVGPLNRKGALNSIKRRVKLWQAAVGQEISARQRGIGVLAASFLWFRKRTSQARGTYYVRNRTGKPLGYVQSEDAFARIVGETDGLAEVDSRYGIVSAAIIEAQADMIEYINRKQGQLSRQLFGGAT